jgi:hypothetical protein
MPLHHLTGESNRGAAFRGGHAGILAGIFPKDARTNAVMAGTNARSTAGD